MTDVKLGATEEEKVLGVMSRSRLKIFQSSASKFNKSKLGKFAPAQPKNRLCNHSSWIDDKRLLY